MSKTHEFLHQKGLSRASRHRLAASQTRGLDSLQVILIEVELGGEEVTILNLIVSNHTLVLESTGVLNVAPGLTQESVERNLGMELFTISQLETRRTEDLELVVMEMGTEVDEVVRVGKGHSEQVSGQNDLLVVLQSDGTELELVNVLRGLDLLAINEHLKTLASGTSDNLHLLVTNQNTNKVDIGTGVRPANGGVVNALTRGQVHESAVHLERGR